MEQEPAIDFLEEAKQAVTEAPENIERELSKGTENTWFDCFNTNASYVLGYFEISKNLPSDKAEIWKQHAQQLKDEIQRRRDEAGEEPVQIKEEEKDQLMKLLNIFRELDQEK